MQMYPRYGFATRGGFAFTPRPAPRRGLRGLSRVQLNYGNVRGALGDSINSPGTPGSSTFYMQGLNDDGTQDTGASTSDILTTISDSIGKIATAAGTAYTAAQLAKINAQRAAAGQPMLSTLPTVGVQASVAPGTLGAGIGGIALIGAIAIGAIFLLRRR